MVAGTQTCGFAVLRDSTAPRVQAADDLDVLLLLDAATGTLLLAPDPSCWTSTTTEPSFDITRSITQVVVDRAACLPLGATPDDAATADGVRRLLLAADAVGCLERSLERAVAYAGQRVAFGRPLGGFQAVQHRLVDHTIRVRGMSLAVQEAARALTDGAPSAARSTTLAEISVSTDAVGILHDLVQLTGGIGFTWEHGLHAFERRAHGDALLAGNPRRAVRTLAEQEGWSR